MGTLFVIEGVDGAGKATQTAKLVERLTADGKNPLKVTFPDYENKSSDIVKMYLNGAFGAHADDVNAKAASTFFALDRYVSYKTRWEADYLSDRVIVADRYVTSNMIHQASKLDTIEEKEAFIDWLTDFEYGIYKLPAPSKVVFLDMPPKYAAELTKTRANKSTGEMVQDIHESDRAYIQKSYENALWVAKRYGWHIISCVKDGCIRTIDDISDEVYNYFMNA